MTGPVDLSVRTPALQKAAEAYASKFDQVEEDENDAEEENTEEDHAAADGGGASGGPRA